MVLRGGVLQRKKKLGEESWASGMWGYHAAGFKNILYPYQQNWVAKWKSVQRKACSKLAKVKHLLRISTICAKDSQATETLIVMGEQRGGLGTYFQAAEGQRASTWAIFAIFPKSNAFLGTFWLKFLL